MPLLVKTTLLKMSFWLLLPISAIQGLRLRKTAIRLPEADGEKYGMCGEGKQFQLLAIGDSIIAGVGTGTMRRSLPVQFADALANTLQRSVRWWAKGWNGTDISNLYEKIKGLNGYEQADLILISSSPIPQGPTSFAF